MTQNLGLIYWVMDAGLKMVVVQCSGKNRSSRWYWIEDRERMQHGESCVIVGYKQTQCINRPSVAWAVL